jgi:hypothetical protein
VELLAGPGHKKSVNKALNLLKRLEEETWLETKLARTVALKKSLTQEASGGGANISTPNTPLKQGGCEKPDFKPQFVKL